MKTELKSYSLNTLIVAQNHGILIQSSTADHWFPHWLLNPRFVQGRKKLEMKIGGSVIRDAAI